MFRHVDVRQMPAPSDQGILSVGVQGGSSNLQSDRCSGSDSSTANSAVQPSRGAALLTYLLENYLQTSQQSQDDCTQRNERNAIRVMLTGPCAMRATKAESARERVERHYSKVVHLASDTFDKILLWILPLSANSSIELAIPSDSHLHSIHDCTDGKTHRNLVHGRW